MCKGADSGALTQKFRWRRSPSGMTMGVLFLTVVLGVSFCGSAGAQPIVEPPEASQQDRTQLGANAKRVPPSAAGNVFDVFCGPSGC
jgi:hypothetical protein